MSVRTVAEKFMGLCSKGKHFEFMQPMYAADIVSVEDNINVETNLIEAGASAGVA